eukprot:scaffold1298_cov382-Prasinococcus_capsulatus_cf.AAC.25
MWRPLADALLRAECQPNQREVHWKESTRLVSGENGAAGFRLLSMRAMKEASASTIGLVVHERVGRCAGAASVRMSIHAFRYPTSVCVRAPVGACGALAPHARCAKSGKQRRGLRRGSVGAAAREAEAGVRAAGGGTNP